MAIPPGLATPVWPPSGIALASIVLLGTRTWPGIWIGAFLLNTTQLLAIEGAEVSRAVLVAVGIATGSTLQPLLGARLLERAVAARNPLARTSDVLRFVGLAGVAGCMTSASIGVTSVWLGGFAAQGELAANWLTWWLGDLAGVLLLTPLFLSWSQRVSAQKSQRWLELALCFALVLSAGTFLFSSVPPSPLCSPAAALLLIPFLLWAAFRFGAQETTAVLVVIAGLAVWGTVHHEGPFGLASLHYSRLWLEAFLAVAALIALCTGATVTESRVAQAALRRENDELDVAVRERTRELVQANVALQAEIAERKRAEEERRAIEHVLREAQKLESLGVLAGGIAHDFNNILTGVLGNADLAQSTLAPGSSGHARLDEVIRSTRRAAELCNQMLAYSGRGRRVVERLSLNAVVDEVLELLRASISKKAELGLALAHGLPAVEADRNQMCQVLMNLLLNASEALGEAPGQIRITTSLAELPAERLASMHHAPLARAGAHVCLALTDTGAGMAPATLQRIFEPFFTTKFTGRGMGLSAVLGIVRSHGGALEVTSAPGQGSTFRLYLPCCVGDDPSPRPRAREPQGELRGHGKILVVDDEPVVRAVCEQILRPLGFEVVEAADGSEGIERFRAHAGELCAVLLDLTMPKQGGAEVLAELRRIAPEVPVVVMTGYDEAESARRFGRSGPEAFLHKPFLAAELEARLRLLLAR
jgi:signal transduction histidine kinase/CheY-like chemotaxis protein